MKLNIKKNEFLKYLKYCYSIIEENSINPILSYVLIKFTNSKIEYICSNKKIFAKFEQKTNFKIDEDFEILIKIKNLINVISKISSNEIELTKNEERNISLKADKFECFLNILNLENYPEFDFDIKNNCYNINLNSQLINTVLKKIGYICFNDPENLKIISGVNFDIQKNKSVFCATDSFRVSKIEKEISNSNDFNFTIESKILDRINSVFEENEKIDFLLKENKLIIKSENKILFLNSIDGKFPDIQKLFEIQANTKFCINRNLLFSAIERAISIASSDKNSTIDLFITLNFLKIEVISCEFGTSIEEINIDEFEGNEIKIKLNGNFLLSLLKIWSTEKIWFSINSNNKPIILYDKNNDELKQIILPMRF